MVDYTRVVAGLPGARRERSWLQPGDWTPDADSIVPTLGAHAAVLAVIAAMTAPGDKIAFEELTYRLDRAQRQSDRPPQRRSSERRDGPIPRISSASARSSTRRSPS